jgi:ATP-dependent DNA ligase
LTKSIGWQALPHERHIIARATEELKLDGFRAEGIKSGGRVHLRSRNNKDFNAKYPAIVQALAAMPDETVIDGEIVALESGRHSLRFRITGPAPQHWSITSLTCWFSPAHES